MTTVRHDQQALDTMMASGFRHLVVTNGGKLHGVVSFRDLVSSSVQDRRQLAVHDVMRTDDVRVAAPDESIRDAAQRMVIHHIGCLPVRAKDGELLGILTRTDLLNAAVSAIESAGGFGGLPLQAKDPDE